MFPTRKMLAVVLVLTFDWRVVSSVLWYCDNLDCPQDPDLFVHKSTEVDMYEKGNCFLDQVTRCPQTFGTLCAAVCSLKGCVHFIEGSDGCLLLGVGTLPSHATRAVYRGPSSASTFYEVARGKPVNASSINPQEAQFNWDAKNANDGVTSNDLHFFHSMGRTSDDPNPYLQIDLLKSYAVYKISFLPRIQSNAFLVAYGRGANLTVYVGSAEVTDGNYAGVYEQLLFITNQNVTAPGQLGWSHLEAPSPKCGRYIVVKKEQVAHNSTMIPLEIMEIQVFTKDL